MKHLPSTLLSCGRAIRQRRTLVRTLGGCAYAGVGLVVVVLAIAAAFYMRLSAGPVAVAGIEGRAAEALAERLGPGWTVTLTDTALQLDRGALALRAADLDIRNPDGVLVVRAPLAIVSVDFMSLLVANPQPRSIELRDLQLRAAINRDGSLSFMAAGEGAAEAASAPTAAAPGEVAATDRGPAGDGAAPPSGLSVALGALFDLILDPANITGALDRARIANAKLTLIDADRRERVAFSRVDASFERVGTWARRFEMRLNGTQGAWRLAGEVEAAEDGRAGTVTVSNVPIHDLLLLSGLSGVPGSSNLKLSGHAEATLAEDRLTRLDARLRTGSGSIEIDDKDMPPIRVDAATASASWDEGRRSFTLHEIEFESGATELHMGGELALGVDGADWRATLAGKDAVIAGATPTDPPFALAAIEARLSGRDDGITVERLALQGQELSVAVEGSYSAADAAGLRVNAHASHVDARAALRLWPNSVVPGVRRFLIDRLRTGTLDRLNATVALTPQQLSDAVSGGPVPDAAVAVDFAVGNAELSVADGLPPLAGLQVEGHVSGDKASVYASTGRVQMPDGRALSLGDASFTVADLGPAEVVAQIAFGLDGGADALGSLLQAPALRNAAGLELDPASIKGRAEMRVSLALPLEDVPDMNQLPVVVTGNLSDLAIDRAFGRERLEAAHLALAYDRGALSIRGEGRIGGAPAAIDVRQPRGDPGEAVVTMTLDEAARARRGWPVAPQLSGPVSLRATVPFAKGGKAATRLEIDLARAAVDNLLPGWTKPAGKAGRLVALLNEGNPNEIRELALDSGSVQVRGSATLNAEGGLEKAELTSLKLSPGDDIRARIERANGGYRVSVRGASLDARPFIKSLTAPSRQDKNASRDARDLKLDLAVDTVTGFNEEAMTNASIKASIRGRDLRELQLRGRFRAAPVSAQLMRRDRSPVIVVQSDDAGTTLRFVDLYRRMIGGRLTFQVTAGDAPQLGTVDVDGFALRNEPALRRIITRQPAPRPDDRGSGAPAAPIDTSEVQFAKLKADFLRTAHRFEFRDAVMWGAQIGFTLAGWIDYARDRTDITGTFIPAFGLNNMFSQVPLFGPLLGGGQNEGLFAVNFRISGPASAPTLTVNPLSAVAPGFLRKLFGAGSAASDATATVPSPPEP